MTAQRQNRLATTELRHSRLALKLDRGIPEGKRFGTQENIVVSSCMCHFHTATIRQRLKERQLGDLGSLDVIAPGDYNVTRVKAVWWERLKLRVA